MLFLCNCSGHSLCVPPPATRCAGVSWLLCVCKAQVSRLGMCSTLPSHCHILHPSSLSTTNRCCRMPQESTWDRNLPSWQVVVVPRRSTCPLAQNTSCMLRRGDGRMTFTVTLQSEGFVFPHLPGAIFSQVRFRLCPLSPMNSLHAALTRKVRFMVLEFKWQGSQEERRTSSHSSKAAKIVYRNCTGSRIK